MNDPAAEAREIVDANRYMVLGTVGADGAPWVSPVWFAHAGYREFAWVSDPGARHSRNLGDRPEVSVVIFDSRVPVGGARVVYMEAVAAELRGEDLERGLAVFAAESRAQGLREWTAADVTEGARHRLFHAVASRHFVLGERDERVEAQV
jgi:predicted pyridoxine 5'-phosphate oxidase superfamily flavin-nucleotide-binding protein